MSLAEAVSYALADEPEEAWRSGPRRTLTRRELEVATLVAQGLTNRGIAASAITCRSAPSTRTSTTS